MRIDRCPSCKTDLRGGLIPEEHLRAGYYGKWDGISKQYYYRTIGVEIPELYDGTAFWLCPDCGHVWAKKGFEDLFDKALAFYKKDSYNGTPTEA